VKTHESWCNTTISLLLLGCLLFGRLLSGLLGFLLGHQKISFRSGLASCSVSNRAGIAPYQHLAAKQRKRTKPATS
jgi:hypothetical protein